jgi:hypothetical protein
MKLGVSDAYADFLGTWSSACGVPAYLFKAQLDAMLEREIVECIRPFTDELTRRLEAMAERRDPIALALSRLLDDLIVFLGQHDCEGLLDGLGCEHAAPLVERLKKAQDVLGLAPAVAAGED